MRLTLLVAIAGTVVSGLVLALPQAAPLVAQGGDLSTPAVPAGDLSMPPFAAESPQRLIDRLVEAREGDASDVAAQLVSAAQSNEDVVRLLLTRLGNARGRAAVIATLARIGTPAATQLKPMLADERAEVRWSILRILLSMSQPPQDLVIKSLPLLRDPDVHVRRWTVMLVKGSDSTEVTDVLLAATNDPDAEVRWRALRALEERVRSSEAVRGRFQRASHDQDADVRYVASRALLPPE